MKPKKYSSVGIVLIMILSTLTVFFSVPITSDETTIIVWLSADLHINRNSDPSYKNKFWDAVNDTNGIGVDYAWCVGDLLDNPVWNQFMDCWDDLTVTTYKNISIGNHDTDWNDNVNSPWYGIQQTSSGGMWYSYDIGNIRVVVGGDERTVFGNENGHGECFMYSGAQRNFINSTIQGASGLNTWVIFHQPLNDTTDRSDEHDYWTIVETNSTYDGAPKFNQMMQYLDDIGESPCAFFSGHTHNSCTDNTSDELLMVKKYGTMFIQIGSITGLGGTPDEHDPCSRYIYLTTGSKTATVKSYNHDNNSFVQSKEYTFQLDYIFSLSLPDPEAPQISSVGYEVGNDTGITISDTTPMFNWTRRYNTFRYNLVIANDSAFTDVYRNLTDISEANYPIEYTEDAVIVSFTLPEVYALTVGNTYYVRVRAMGW